MTRTGAIDVHYPESGGARAALVVGGDPHGRPGLGAHVRDELGIPVVGVAKTAFQGATHAVAIRRGGAERPHSVSMENSMEIRRAACV